MIYQINIEWRQPSRFTSALQGHDQFSFVFSLLSSLLHNAKAHLRGALAGPHAAVDSLTLTFAPKGRYASVPCQVQRLVRLLFYGY